MEYSRGYVMTYEKCIGIKLMKRSCTDSRPQLTQLLENLADLISLHVNMHLSSVERCRTGDVGTV